MVLFLVSRVLYIDTWIKVRRTKMKDLFIKFINRDCSEEEIKQIVSYFQNSKDFSGVPTIEEVVFLLDKYPDMEEASANRISNKILNNSQKVQLKPIKLSSYFLKYAIAAALIGVLAAAYFLRDVLYNIKDSSPTIVNNTIEPGTDKATLTLEDGSIIALEKGNTYQMKNANSNGEEIVYEAGKGHTKEIAYNYLTIPRGGQFHLILSDSTEIWLNSESQLKYPVTFSEEKTRQIELIYGEAYFNVSPSSKHHGTKFKVHTGGQEVEVLGTEFNIKAYKDEDNIYTTLVEGKIEISNKEKSEILKPNQQSIIGKTNSNIIIKKVEVYSAISWKNGVFNFKGMSLRQMCKVLSRWYDVEFVIENPNLQNIAFVGVIRKELSIDEILSSMIKSSQISSYEINDKTVIIK
ncbi:FecR family protein [Gaetbulibacter sp. M235]|uniref:FecR family protein n=1 Tax=Gaetbulibacter sp. M235 TaxID=3126510 RepID=UPI00374E58DE